MVHEASYPETVQAIIDMFECEVCEEGLVHLRMVGCWGVGGVGAGRTCCQTILCGTQ